jgi:hypothetical protein
LEKIIWLNGVPNQTWELPLQQNLYLMLPPTHPGADLLLAVPAFLTGLGFQAHWFPFANSYLILEAKFKRSRFCILAWQAQHEVLFRFVRTAYEPEWLQNEAGETLLPQALETTLQERGLEYSPIIVDPGTYQQWLSGANQRMGLPNLAPHTKDWLALAKGFSLRPLKRLLIQARGVQNEGLDLPPLIRILRSFQKDRADLQAYRDTIDLRQEILTLQEEVNRLNLAQKALAEEARFSSPIPETSSKTNTSLPDPDERQRQIFLLRGKLAFASERKASYASYHMEQLERWVEAWEQQNPAAVPETLFPDYLKEWQDSLSEWFQMAKQAEGEALLALMQRLKKLIGEITLPTESSSNQHLDKLLTWEKKRLQWQFELRELKQQQNRWEQERDLNLEQLKQSLSEAKEDIEKEKAFLVQQQKELQNQKAQFRQSLMAWLEANYPDWQDSFGKILREDVLHSSYLSPRIDRLNELIFGVQLDLSELEIPAQLVQDFGQNEKKLAEALTKLTRDWVGEEQNRKRQIQHTEKRWRQKIRENQREQQKLQYEIDQAQSRIRKLKNQIQQYGQKHAQNPVRWQYELDELYRAVNLFNREESDLRASLHEKWEQLRSHGGSMLAAAPSEKSEAEQLAMGRQFQPLVAQYRREKLWLFDWIPIWEQKLTQLEREITEQERQTTQAETAPDMETEMRLQIEGLEQSLAAKNKLLQQKTQKFLGRFHPENQLGFPVEIQTPEEQLSFLEKLQRFQLENQIEDVREKIQLQHAAALLKIAEIIQSIRPLPKDLAESVGQLQSQLQAWFKGGKISLTEPSHPLVKTMTQLKQFAQTHGESLGEPSLFNVNQNQTSNARAWQLLETLHQTLLNYAQDTLCLEDLFGLQLSALPVAPTAISIDRIPLHLPLRFAIHLRLVLQSAMLELIPRPDEKNLLPPLVIGPEFNLDSVFLDQLIAKCKSQNQPVLLSGKMPLQSSFPGRVVGSLDGKKLLEIKVSA